MRTVFIAVLAAITLFTAPVPSAHAQAYPSKGLRIIVPFAAGGSTDIFARLIGDRLSTALGQPVVIENRPGAARQHRCRSRRRSRRPDGYTLLMATTGVMAINNALYKNMTYDAAKDLEPVIFIASITNVLIVPVDSPFKSVGDVLAAAKAAPGKVFVRLVRRRFVDAHVGRAVQAHGGQSTCCTFRTKAVARRCRT